MIPGKTADNTAQIDSLQGQESNMCCDITVAMLMDFVAEVKRAATEAMGTKI